MSEQTTKLCECGCGKPTKPAPDTRRKLGQVKGQPMRYIYQHGRRRPWEQRFWEKVNKTEGCWLWTAGLTSTGYPSFESRVGTRVLWEKLNGPIPPGLFVMHKCDTPKCVRLDHLMLGTRQDNTNDATVKGRMSHGMKHWCATLTPEIVIQIRALYKPRIFTKNDIAAKLGVSKWAVEDVLRGRSWKWVNRTAA